MVRMPLLASSPVFAAAPHSPRPVRVRILTRSHLWFMFNMLWLSIGRLLKLADLVKFWLTIRLC